MREILFILSMCLPICGIPQIYKLWKVKDSKGISFLTVYLVILGSFSVLGLLILDKASWQVITPVALNIITVFIQLFLMYYYQPKKYKTVVSETKYYKLDLCTTCLSTDIYELFKDGLHCIECGRIKNEERT